MEIRVSRANRSSYSVEVESSETTVGSVKAKIEEKEGIPCAEQRLMMMGIRLQNGNTLKDYNIKPFQSISLAWIEGGEMQVFIRYQGGAFLLEVHKSQSIASVIAKIRDRLQILPHHKKLLVLGNVVLDDGKPVSSYKGIDLSVLKLIDA